MRVIFACAGTGGHINPAIAIANIILKNEPDSKIMFIGTKNGLENEMVPKSGFEIKHIRTGKLLRKLTLKNIRAIIDSYNGITDAKKILKEFKPDIVIGTGGYICGPVMLASKRLGIPYILHESNAFPGVSVKLLAKNAAKVLVGFKEASNRLPKNSDVVYTGTPTKFSIDTIKNLDKKVCLKKLGLDKVNKNIVLVTCGSQGARRVNDTVLELIKEKLDDEIFIVLVAGPKNYEDVLVQVKKIEEEIGKNLDEYIKVERFVFNMEEMYKVADVCITRAGAMTITELAIAGKPSILIPLPTAAENHQYYNAKVLEDINCAKIIEEKYLNVNTLHDSLKNIISSKEYLETSRKSHTILEENVNDTIFMCIKDVVKK